MEQQFLDTNVVIRHITDDNPEKAGRARGILKQAEAGEIVLIISESVIVEIVQVLSSARLYNVPRQQVADAVSTIVELRGLKIPSKATYLHALELWAESSIDFVDALSVAHVQRQGITTIVSFDRDFDRFSEITRREP